MNHDLNVFHETRSSKIHKVKEVNHVLVLKLREYFDLVDGT